MLGPTQDSLIKWFGMCWSERIGAAWCEEHGVYECLLLSHTNIKIYGTGTAIFSSSDDCSVGVHEPDLSQQHNGAVMLEIYIHAMETNQEHGSSF